MNTIKYDGKPLPEWVDLELRKLSPEPNFNTLIELLLLDYINRNAPKDQVTLCEPSGAV